MSSKIIDFNSKDSPLEILYKCGGYYECPKDVDGKRLGLLVGYAGQYDGGKHYVGDVYANFAEAEKFPIVLQHLCASLHGLIPKSLLGTVTAFFGAPIGGLSAACLLALGNNCQYGFVEKKVLKAAAGAEREESILVFGRHKIEKGDEIIIVEDVCNNFSTTEEMVNLIHNAGGLVLAIASLLNRSATVDSTYHSHCGGAIPVISLVRKIIPQYRQDDPEVAADIAAGNIVWKPKAEWPRLMAAMAKAQ